MEKLSWSLIARDSIDLTLVNYFENEWWKNQWEICLLENKKSNAINEGKKICTYINCSIYRDKFLFNKVGRNKNWLNIYFDW